MKKIVYYYATDGLYFLSAYIENDVHSEPYPDPSAKELIAIYFKMRSSSSVNEHAIVLDSYSTYIVPVFKILVDEENLGNLTIDSSRSFAVNSAAVVLATNYGDHFHDAVFPKKDEIYSQTPILFDATKWSNLTLKALSKVVDRYAKDGVALNWREESEFLHAALRALDVSSKPLTVKVNAAFNLFFQEAKNVMHASKFNVRGSYFAVLMVMLEYFQTMSGSKHLDAASLKLLAHWQQQMELISKLVAYIDSFSTFSQMFKSSYKAEAKELLEKVFHAGDAQALQAIITLNQHLIVEITRANNAPVIRENAFRRSV